MKRSGIRHAAPNAGPARLGHADEAGPDADVLPRCGVPADRVRAGSPAHGSWAGFAR
ncbi:hypothetical protein [Actinosynnema sp. NPDC023587]|uniref:hypothetical protein n=1 Tax=Actinosynnema sp. NPDC023587 TaxID=3154695 RepID=UPI0033C0890B